MPFKLLLLFFLPQIVFASMDCSRIHLAENLRPLKGNSWQRLDKLKTPRKFIEVKDLILEAGEMSLEFLHKFRDEEGFVKEKKDQSLVTRADKEISKFLVQGLRDLFPKIPVVSEESVGQFDKKPSRYFLIDPIDNTWGFVQKEPMYTREYSINLALVQNGLPVYGIILLPAQNLLYFGGSKIGAWRMDQNGLKRFIQYEQARPKKVRTMVGGTTDKVTIKSMLAARDLEYAGHRIMGSAQKFMEILEGRADVYVYGGKNGSPSLWDVAAGDAILRASVYGEEVTMIDTFNYDLNQLEVGHFVYGLGNR